LSRGPRWGACGAQCGRGGFAGNASDGHRIFSFARSRARPIDDGYENVFRKLPARDRRVKTISSYTFAIFSKTHPRIAPGFA